MHHLLKLRATCEFFEAAPVFRPLRLGDLSANRLQIELALLARTNLLAVLLSVLALNLHIKILLKFIYDTSNNS